ncbi:MAG: hypothetical protein K2J64_09525 [Desulfovibrio sp.]|nr:hypothetical protein [Desulfovibrio sp.]
MIRASLSFPSVALLRPVRVEVALPHGICAAPRPWRSLWALHCALSDASLFFEDLGAGALVDELGFALIAPSLGNGFFLNTPLEAQADFLDELYCALVQILPLSREGCAVAGVSMGAFGALRWALASGHFTSAALVSGLYFAGLAPDERFSQNRGQRALYQTFKNAMRRALLDDGGEPRAGADPARLLEAVAGHFPGLHIFCGEEDWLALPQSLALERLCAEHGASATLTLSPGGHDRDYWRGAFRAACETIFS